MGTATAPKATSVTLAADLYGLVVYLNATGQRDFLEALLKEELSFSQLQLLDRIRAGARPTIQQAAAMMKLSCQGASRAVDNLSRRGLVQREPAEHDFRAKRITITPRGVEAVERLHAARMPAIVTFARTLAPAERAELADALSPIVQRPEIAPYRPNLEAA